ncbi:MAG: shikimate kinase [Bosea sp. (in: a-proteobacteria)]
MELTPAIPALHEAAEDCGALLRGQLGVRSIVLVGMMGSGKSTIGTRLALRTGLRFVDADTEIERAARMSIPDIFASRGEAEFRAGERRVIARLLGQGPQIIATGGGAFMSAETREKVAASGVSVWLRADPETLLKRVRKRANRPLLQTEDPEGTLRRLLIEREPVYALSDIDVLSREEPHDVVVDAVLSALDAYLAPSS